MMTSRTILEKNMVEMQTMLNWAKPGHFGSRAAFETRFGQLNQFDHLTGDEKVQQFRESCADGAFFHCHVDPRVDPWRSSARRRTPLTTKTP
jgi:hypothetical protein